ncbi:hypothetical protein SSABA_v1c04330 [Spiroplasma sabaudiense Ar-1343]|uniref:Uncharacterized protein n=1 Tax=Spiroplasma sabaudiense Ar-1343 TaxID=1276257 RepID=W6AAH0_9MOLU|nr:hypothetical protein [Spiroplasma sabaudiense]AHI53840.1 hypothetical protein SSABA_v1c04330 [Spiroplasma sabaudiense Ar-1343]
MKNIKYVAIPTKYEFKPQRFYIGILYEDADNYFFMSRQACKKPEKDSDFYIARLDMRNHQNHKLIDLETEEEVGKISDADILTIFSVCEDKKLIQLAFGDDDKEETNNDELLDRITILEKELDLMRLKLATLEKKLK